MDCLCFLTRLAKDSTIIYRGSIKQYTLIIAVFSACAEMFPNEVFFAEDSIRFLCMRRDPFFDIKPQWFALYSA